jgi:translocator protein
MDEETGAHLPATKSHRVKTLLFFSLGTFLVGQLTGFLGFLLFPFDLLHTSYHPPVISLPAWMFPVVWCILYPCMGLSMGYAWLEKKRGDVTAVLIAYLILLAANILFVPIMNLSQGNPAIMTLMDINGVIAAGLFSWLCRRYSRKAFYWSLPLTTWMPVTLLLKIALWIANPV